MPDREHTLHAKVLTPEGEVFDGEVEQLSTRTAVGEIGVLANHVPVLARLRPTELRLHMPDGETQRWAQAEGWLQVFANRATVLVGEAIPPDRLDQGQLRSRVEDAEQRLNEAEEGSGAYRQAERDKERAEAFLEVASGEGAPQA
jgi:F-type H+-transporting ATPase subunit epsilon